NGSSNSSAGAMNYASRSSPYTSCRGRTSSGPRKRSARSARSSGTWSMTSRSATGSKSPSSATARCTRPTCATGSTGRGPRLPRIRVNIAAGYAGRQEIVTAVRELLQESLDEGRSLAHAIESVTEDGISEHLYTKGQPDPDLIIRSSGEQRLSGFLIWQSAYT